MSLPEAEFFTLEEIAQRWNCSVRAILCCGMKQQSTVASTNRRNQHDLQNLGMLRLKALVSMGSCQPETLEEVGRRGSNVPRKYKPILDLCLPEIPVIFVSDLIARRSVELRHGYFRDQFDVMHFGELVERGSLSDPVKINIGDVVMMRCDRDKFERSYDVGCPNNERTAHTLGDIHPRTKNNYLRLIMALATTAVRGFDPRKPYEAANVIRETAEVDIDEKTLASYVSEAYELQTKERK